jgi:hypothetical protein
MAGANGQMEETKGGSKFDAAASGGGREVGGQGGARGGPGGGNLFFIALFLFKKSLSSLNDSRILNSRQCVCRCQATFGIDKHFTFTQVITAAAIWLLHDHTKK